MSGIRRIASSKFLSIILLIILGTMMILDNYTTECAANIMEDAGISFDKIESNQIVISFVNEYGWPAFHFLKIFIIVALSIIVVYIEEKSRLIANLILLIQSSIYCYVVYHNYEQLLVLWDKY